jgi:hypothetical protein
MSNHIRTCGTCGQAIGVGSDAVESIHKKVIEEVLILLSDKYLEPRDIRKILKQKYGLKEQWDE